MNQRLAAAAVMIAAFVAACSGSSTPATTAAPITAPPSVAASAAPSTAPASAAASSPAGNSSDVGNGYGNYGGGASAAAGSGGGSLALATTSLGSVLVGPTGMTLYLFTPDTTTSSACTGTCAATWPPLAGSLPALGTGLNASDFGAITRADGSKQITFHGHPLYYYAGDQKAGDTTGQGKFGKWYVVGADGNPIK